MSTSGNSDCTIVEADLTQKAHTDAVLLLIDRYAQDPMGDGKPLPEDVMQRLIPGLRTHPTTIIFLAWRENEPIGIAVCFLGFSTFKARPLINIHDLAITPGHRGTGAGKSLIAAVETKARRLGCCKITLEVQQNNHRAKRVYEAAGFSRVQYQEAAGKALFMSKPLV